jgi:hypothetical protein
MFHILLIVLTHGRIAAAEAPMERTDVNLAEEATSDEIEQWVPALSIAMGLLLQNASANSETSQLSDGPLQPGIPQPNPTIAPPADGQDLMFAPISDLSLELMTPGLMTVPGRPRIFVHGDLGINFSQEYDLARAGKVEEFILPDKINRPEEFEIRGQGLTGQARSDTLVWSAGGGLAMTLDVFERRVRIKPSLEWLRETIILKLDVRRLQKIQNSPGFLDLSDFRQVLISGRKTKVFHGIGPGLEIEVDSKRAGSFVVSTFMGARLHRIMGNRKVDLKAANPDDANETATLHYKNGRWAYRAFFGIRVRLVPE